MPAYKDSKTGTWFVKFYCKDWTGENKQIKKRGFATKREALDYERNYKIRQENNLDMTFGEFWKLYTEDVKNYVKLNTWLTKEHIDPYYTLIGYFNSIRELGGAVRLLDDDIASRIRVVKNKYNSSEQRYLSFEGKKEITSRIPSWEIAQVLEKLAISYDKNKEKQDCYDVVIATNMIAVGMDVDRLDNYYDVIDCIKNEVVYLLFQNREFLMHFNIFMSDVLPRKSDRKNVPLWVKRAVKYRDRCKCVMCQKDLSGIMDIEEQYENQYDHIVPLEDGGLNDVCSLCIFGFR